MDRVVDYIKGTHPSRLNNQAVYLNDLRISKIKGWIRDYCKKCSIVREIDSKRLQNAYYMFLTLNDSGVSLANLSMLKFINANMKSEQASRLS
jgi:hypothetical protein